MFSVEFLKRWYNGMLKIFECDQSSYFFLKCAVVRAECTKTRIVDVSVTYVTYSSVVMIYYITGGDKDSDGPSESGDNTSESTQGPPSEPAQEKGTTIFTFL